MRVALTRPTWLTKSITTAVIGANVLREIGKVHLKKKKLMQNYLLRKSARILKGGSSASMEEPT